MTKKQTGLKKPPDQVRRRNSKDITTLPAAGRPGKAPAWPIKPGANAREKELWATVWAKPQAVIWEAWHAEELVARYVRVAVRCEVPDAGTKIMSEVRQMEDRLGLSPMAAFRLQWTLTEGQATQLASVTDLDRQRQALS